MKRMRRAVMVVCVVLGIAAIVPWLNTAPRQSAAAAGDSPESLVMPGLNDPAPLDSYTETLRRPVFLASRRTVDEQAQTATGEPLLLGRYKVAGVVIAGERRIVLIRQGTGDKVSRITQGTELDGWTLTEVTRQHLVLEKAGQRQEFVLQQGKSGAE